MCELHGAVFSLCSAVKSSAGVLCLILVISGKMWVIRIMEESENEGL